MSDATQRKKATVIQQYQAYFPIPPTLNHYRTPVITRKRNGRGQTTRLVTSPEGRVYKKLAKLMVKPLEYPLQGSLTVSLVFHFVDKRLRDLDNYVKAVLDSASEIGVWIDDSMIDTLIVVRGAPDKDNPGVSMIVEQEISTREYLEQEGLDGQAIH